MSYDIEFNDGWVVKELVSMLNCYGGVRLYHEGGKAFLALEPGTNGREYVVLTGTRAEVGRYISTARAIVHERGKNDSVASVRGRSN